MRNAGIPEAGFLNSLTKVRVRGNGLLQWGPAGRHRKDVTVWRWGEYAALQVLGSGVF